MGHLLGLGSLRAVLNAEVRLLGWFYLGYGLSYMGVNSAAGSVGRWWVAVEFF